LPGFRPDDGSTADLARSEDPSSVPVPFLFLDDIREKLKLIVR